MLVNDLIILMILMTNPFKAKISHKIYVILLQIKLFYILHVLREKN